jgi:hypothetical protein
MMQRERLYPHANPHFGLRHWITAKITYKDFAQSIYSDTSHVKPAWDFPILMRSNHAFLN